MKLIDISGCKFGRLTVVSLDKSTGRRSFWLCKCDCGKETIVMKDNLRNGNTRSCGCIKTENPPRKTHGESKTKLHFVWNTMKARCKTKSVRNYNNYGGRGISVCKEWEDYINFRNWSINNGYEDGLTIERIDVNGNYCPQNCTWATRKEQARNKRNNLLHEIDGVTKPLIEWCEILNKNYEKARHRVQKRKTPF